MFGILRSSGDESDEEEQEENNHSITNREMELKVRECNDMVTQVNQCGWSEYKLPENPSYGQVNMLYDDLSKLYSKVSENRPHDHEERKKILNATQAVMELRDMYHIYTYEGVENP